MALKLDAKYVAAITLMMYIVLAVVYPVYAWNNWLIMFLFMIPPIFAGASTRSAAVGFLLFLFSVICILFAASPMYLNGLIVWFIVHWQVLVLFAIIALIFIAALAESELLVAIFVIALIVWIIVWILTVIAGLTQVGNMLWLNIVHAEVSKLPEIPLDRYLPLSVAEFYTESQLALSNYKIMHTMIVANSTLIMWQIFLAPSNMWNMISGLGTIIVSINAKQTTPTLLAEVKAPDAKWWYADDWRNIIVRTVGFGKIYCFEDAYLWKHYIVVPVSKLVFGPFGVVIPQPAGVALYDVDTGKVTFAPLDSNIVKQLPIVVCENYLRWYVTTANWHTGFWNVWFTHANMWEIASTGDPNNKQPYLTLINGTEPAWVFALEPYGRALKGIVAIVIFNKYGKPIAVKFYWSSPMIGPSVSEQYVMAHYPRISWGLFKVVEPIPVIINDTLYWRDVIVATRGGQPTTVYKIVLVNAKTGQITEITNTIGAITKVQHITRKEKLLTLIRHIEKQVEQLEEELHKLEKLINATK